MANAFRWQLGSCCGCSGRTGTVQALACPTVPQVYGGPAPLLPGIQIEIYSDPGYSNLLARGITTSTNARVGFPLIQYQSTYYVIVTPPTGRLVPVKGSYTINAFGFIYILLQPSPGFACPPTLYGCPSPTTSTIQVSDTWIGNTTMIYGPFGWYGQWVKQCWEAALPDPIPVTYTNTIQWDSAYGIILYIDNGPLFSVVYTLPSGLISCPPGMVVSTQYQPVATCWSQNPPSLSTITVSE